MGKQAHFNIGFIGESDKTLNEQTIKIVGGMTDNPHYTDTGSRVTDVSDAQSEYGDIKGKRGTILNYKLVKKAGKKKLADALIVLGKYARDKYPGNVTIWKTTGYVIQEYDAVIGKPFPPEGLRAEDGVGYGEVLVRYKKVKFVKTYEGRHFIKGTTPPANCTNSSTSLIMEWDNALLNELYGFQIRSKGAKGRSDWSTVVYWYPRRNPDADETKGDKK